MTNPECGELKDPMPPSGSLLLEAMLALFVLGVVSLGLIFLMGRSIQQFHADAWVSEVVPQLPQWRAGASLGDTLRIADGGMVVWPSEIRLEVHVPGGLIRQFHLSTGARVGSSPGEP